MVVALIWMLKETVSTDGSLTDPDSSRSGRLNECSVREGFPLERLTMAGLLPFALLLFSLFGFFVLVCGHLADFTSTVKPTVVSGVDPATKRLSSAWTSNTTEVPTTDFTTSYRKSTAETTTESVNGKEGRKDVRKEPTTKEDEGPLELGKI